jgi:predicted permease
MRDWRAEVRTRLPNIEPDVAEELAQHLEQQYAELRARGQSDDAAREMVLAHLSAAHIADNIPSRRRLPTSDPIGREPTTRTLFSSTWQDVRYGWRSLRRSPAFTIVAVLSLALGIGANTAIFGLLNAVLLERLPLRHPEQLIALERTSGQGANIYFAYSEYLALKQAPSLPRLEAVGGTPATIAARNEQDFFAIDLVTGGYFDLLGLKPILGRLITTDDERANAPVVVLSQDIWEKFFAADPTVVGQVVAIHGASFTVIGVLPRAYHGMYFAGHFSAAVPITVAPLLGAVDVRSPDRPLLLNVLGRLQTSWTTQRASLAFDQVFQACCASVPLPGAPKGPKGPRGANGAVVKLPHVLAIDASRGLSHPKMDLRGEYRRILFLLMGGVIIVLLIACANVGNLLLARATARQRELAVRMSMGATRSRVVRQLLTESFELAALGGVAGLGLSRLGLSILSHSLPSIADLVGMVAVRPSGTILAFTATTTLGCTLLFGVFPALRATRHDIVSPLKEGGRGTGRSRRFGVDRGIVIAQVALALVLVCAATLFVATLRNLKQFDGGYGSTRVLLAQIETRGTPYEKGGITPFYEEILNRARVTPGVSRAAMASVVPVFGGRSMRDQIRVPGYEPAPHEDVSSWYAAVTSDYFGTTGIGLEGGRDFDDRDGATSEPVAIVSHAFARHYFAGRNPIGGSIVLGEGSSATSMRIVGIARDARYADLRSPPTEIYYTPVTQSGSWPFLVLAVRMSGDPETVAPALRHQVRDVAPALRTIGFTGVEAVLDDALARERLAAALATLFGCLAVSLAAVGLYGVVAYNVSRRTQEIGVRMALGARPRDVTWLVVRQTLAMTAIGIVVGVPLALMAARAIGAQLYGVGASDPRAMLGAAALLVVVGAAASIVPGGRAARVDPSEALRAD